MPASLSLWILLSSIFASAGNQQLLLHLQDLSLQHITNILWTYASFLHDVPEMLPAFTSQVLERSHKEQFNAQQLSNLLWSLCILQVCPLWPWAFGPWPWPHGPWPWILHKLSLIWSVCELPSNWTTASRSLYCCEPSAFLGQSFHKYSNGLIHSLAL